MPTVQRHLSVKQLKSIATSKFQFVSSPNSNLSIKQKRYTFLLFYLNSAPFCRSFAIKKDCICSPFLLPSKGFEPEKRVRRGRCKAASGFANCEVSSTEVFSGTAKGGRKNERRRVSPSKKHSDLHPIGCLFFVWRREGFMRNPVRRSSRAAGRVGL